MTFISILLQFLQPKNASFSIVVTVDGIVTDESDENYRTKYGRPEHMEYHELGDIFVCRAGRILWRIGTKHEKTKTGFVSEKALYRCESCEGCPYKQNCTKAKGNKTLSISHARRNYNFNDRGRYPLDDLRIIKTHNNQA